MPQFIPNGTDTPVYESLNDFERAFFTAALWTEEDRLKEEGLEDGGSFSDFDEKTLASFKEDCANFCKSDAYQAAIQCGFWTEEGAGHDFWLTRNHHGTGFWDRHSESTNKAAHDLGDVLTGLCDEFGQADIYVGDDKKIYS